MGCGFSGPVDIANQCRVGTNMYNTAENTQVCMPVDISGTNKTNRFKPGKTIDKIGSVKTFPGFNN